MIALPRPHSRIAALALLLLLLAVAYLILVHPIVKQYRVANASIEALQDQLWRYQRSAANRTQLDNQLRQLKRRSPGAGYYLTGDTVALASAKMQQQLKRAIGASGGQLISTQNLAPGRQDEPSVGLKVHMTGDVQSLLKAFYTLETGKPMLFFDKVVVVGRPARRAGAEASEPILDIRFDLIGYLQGGSG